MTVVVIACDNGRTSSGIHEQPQAVEVIGVTEHWTQLHKMSKSDMT